LQPGQSLGGAAHPYLGVASARSLLGSLKVARNDLEPAALMVQPVIGKALELVARTEGCRLARMSGSGATVFGLYDDCETAASAAKALRRERPGWWVEATSLQ
jgi:4-diphosphocytidyl-2-C-methyl-D-erythritol kinase